MKVQSEHDDVLEATAQTQAVVRLCSDSKTLVQCGKTYPRHPLQVSSETCLGGIRL